ncbi:MAG: Tad domain-containing protein [Sulfitobacter sp.]
MFYNKDRCPDKAANRSATLKFLIDQYARDEDGVVTVFGIFMILMMIIIGGIGVDLMHNEMERTRLQNTLDRAVLAAADLDQPLDSKAVVQDYFDKAGMTDYLTEEPIVDSGLNYRTVTASATSSSPTQFMRMFDVDSLPLAGVGVATERVPKVEISMVLDISGSMDSNNKMANLQTAAKAFVDTVIRPETQDMVSISLIPYSQHVNAGPAIYGELNKNHKHNYSHCIEFPDSHFDSAALNKSYTYTQMQHFQWNTYSIESGYTQNTRYDTVCPRYSYERISPITQNAASLKAQIDSLKPRAGTQIFIGMKWATALLDPSFKSINNALIDDEVLPDDFAARPAEYSDADTLKTVVLMTDGQNSSSSRIKSNRYNSNSEIVQWNNYNFNYYLSRYVSSNKRYQWYETKYTSNQSDNLLENICGAAKEKGIVIWTIGFEATTHGEDTMKDCASSPSHFFSVTGTEISDAFTAIARQIKQLRLTQ